jgi:putative NADH-flavin reductase
MRIAVVGANGRAGLEVVKQGLKRGHQVSAIARRPASVGLEHDNLKIHAADVLAWIHRLAGQVSGVVPVSG